MLQGLFPYLGTKIINSVSLVMGMLGRERGSSARTG